MTTLYDDGYIYEPTDDEPMGRVIAGPPPAAASDDGSAPQVREIEWPDADPDVDVVDPFAEPDPTDADDVDPDRQYTHSNFAACWLPATDPGDLAAWKSVNGNRKIILRRGDAITKEGKDYSPGLPFGRYARLALAVIMDQAAQSPTPEIELPTIRGMMKMLGMSVGGRNERMFRDQFIRLAACRLTIIGEKNGETYTAKTDIVEEASWWTGGRSARRLVPKTITLNAKFHRIVRRDKMPYPLQDYASLTRSPLALDLYLWLAYQAPRAKGKPLPWTTIRRVFVPHEIDAATGEIVFSGTETQAGFRSRFERALEKVEVAYPDVKGKVKMDDDGVTLKKAKPAVARPKSK